MNTPLPSKGSGLERTGDGSRTESRNTERLIAYLDSLGAEPSTPRVREYVWILVACVLAVAWIDGGGLGTQIVEERHQQIVGCISQYAAGERWSRTNTPKCSPMVEAPSYVMTMPVGQ